MVQHVMVVGGEDRQAPSEHAVGSVAGPRQGCPGHAWASGHPARGNDEDVIQAGTGRALVVAGSEVLVFVDPDVLAPGADSSAVTMPIDNDLDVVCPFPRQLAVGPAELLINPLLQWSWLALRPLQVVVRASRLWPTATRGLFLLGGATRPGGRPPPGRDIGAPRRRQRRSRVSTAFATGIRRVSEAVGGVVASPATRVAPALALLAVLLQVCYPLVPDHQRSHVAVVIVAAFAAACVAHAATTRSPRTALAVLAVGTGIGLSAELIGVHTGIPFGRYHYSAALGLRVAGAPLIVALAWTMLAWPSAVVARHLVTGSVARVLVGAWALAAADLFLDPQLVAAGGWSWSSTTPNLPGIPMIPLTNFAGWLVVSLVLSAVLQPLVGVGADGCAIALYLWLWIGWTVAQVCFLDLRGSAAWGFVGMGCVAVPLVRRIRADLLAGKTPRTARAGVGYHQRQPRR